MAPSKGRPHSPVQIQKLMFLVEQEAPVVSEGDHFDFQPYDYGPFDKDVYRVLDDMAAEGFVTIDRGGYVRTFALTPLGYVRGNELFEQLETATQNYLRAASTFVLKQGFYSLVSAIYKAYPDMRENSVLRST